MTIVLILNALMAGFVCLAVISGLAWSIASQPREAVDHRSRRVGRRRDTTAARVWTAESARSGG
jgi:hypothetical protein